MRSLRSLIFSAAFAAAACAGPITITGYDIQDVPASSFGAWYNSYTGTITPLGTTFDSANLVNDTGGSGTLNDGVTLTTESASVLFAVGTNDQSGPLAPVVVLHLNGTFALNSITLFEDTGNDNAIPGVLTGVTVQIGASSAAITGSATGPSSRDLLLNIGASSLAGVTGNTVTLSNFQGNWYGLFDLNEITLTSGSSSVPEPSSLLLLCVGASVMGLLAAGKRAAASVPRGN
jgi:hypothetical protein